MSRGFKILLNSLNLRKSEVEGKEDNSPLTKENKRILGYGRDSELLFLLESILMSLEDAQLWKIL